MKNPFLVYFVSLEHHIPYIVIHSSCFILRYFALTVYPNNVEDYCVFCKNT